jgi:hypothetical protein
LFTSIGYAKDAHFYQNGRIVQMDAVACGYDENSGKSVLGEVIGTDNAHKKTKEMLCQEYVLRSDRVIYRIRPRDEKHPVLLPVGEAAEFRLQKDKLYLRLNELVYSAVDSAPRCFKVATVLQNKDMTTVFLDFNQLGVVQCYGSPQPHAFGT